MNTHLADMSAVRVHGYRTEFILAQAYGLMRGPA